MEKFTPPTHASWESTLKCPLRCKHCGLSAGKVRPKELSTSEAKNMILELAAFGIKNLIISGGEFTARLDWREILEYALPLFDSVRIITCGWLGEKLFQELNKIEDKNNLIISISLDGLEKEHDFRRGTGSFAKVIETLKFPSPIAKTIITTVDSRNIYDLIGILELLLRLNIKWWSVQTCLPAGRMKPELFLGKARIQILAERISKWQKLFAERIDISPDDCMVNLIPDRDGLKWPGCHAGKDLVTIFNDGLVSGCPTMADQIVGDIREQNIDAIWNSKKMNAMRSTCPQECVDCQDCAGGCKAVSKLLKQQFCHTN